jgi:hypothetical protein
MRGERKGERRAVKVIKLRGELRGEMYVKVRQKEKVELGKVGVEERGTKRAGWKAQGIAEQSGKRGVEKSSRELRVELKSDGRCMRPRPAIRRERRELRAYR